MENNKYNIEELLTQAKDAVYFSVQDKNAVRSALLSHMNKGEKKKIHTPILMSMWTRFAVVPFVLLILVGTSVSASSMDAYPGDLLYGVKTAIVEPLVALTQFSPEDKIRYSALRAERRLNEMATLSSEERLNEKEKEDLLFQADKQLVAVREKVDPLPLPQSIAIQSDLEATLRAYDNVFEQINEEDIRQTIGTHVALLNTNRQEQERVLHTQSIGKESVQERQKEVQTFVASIQEKVANDTDRGTLQAKARVDLAEESLVLGNDSIAAGAYTQGTISSERAYRLAKEADVVLTLQKRLALLPEDTIPAVPETLSRASIETKEVVKERTFDTAFIAEEEPEIQHNMSVGDDASATMLVADPQETIHTFFYQELIQSVDGYYITPAILMNQFPGLTEHDFRNVVTESGIYTFTNDTLVLRGSSEYIQKEGVDQLLFNVLSRYKREIQTVEGIEALLTELRKEQEEPLPEEKDEVVDIDTTIENVDDISDSLNTLLEQ